MRLARQAVVLGFTSFAAMGVGGCVTPWSVDGSSDTDALVDSDTDATSEDDTEEERELDLEMRDTAEEEMATVPVDQVSDTCQQAMNAAPVESGYASGTMSGFDSAGMSPSCITTTTRGPDAFHKVHLAAGQSLTASFEAQKANGNAVNSQIYLLRNCNQQNTCEAGSDLTGWDVQDGTEMESLYYENTTGSDVDLYLVLGVRKSGDVASTFDLNVQIN